MPGPMTATLPPPRPLQAAGAAPGGGGLDTNLAMMLSSMQAPEGPNLPGQQTTFPHQPMQMNPAFAQMLMQMLMSQQTPMGQMPGLAGIMGGR